MHIHWIYIKSKFVRGPKTMDNAKNRKILIRGCLTLMNQPCVKIRFKIYIALAWKKLTLGMSDPEYEHRSFRMISKSFGFSGKAATKVHSKGLTHTWGAKTWQTVGTCECEVSTLCRKCHQLPMSLVWWIERPRFIPHSPEEVAALSRKYSHLNIDSFVEKVALRRHVTVEFLWRYHYMSVFFQY